MPGLQDVAERLSGTFDTRVTVSLGKRKGKIVVEFGSVEDPKVPGHKAQWLNDAEAMFKEPTYSQFTAVLHWAGTNTTPECSFNYTTSASATAAFKAFGDDPSYLANPS